MIKTIIKTTDMKKIIITALILTALINHMYSQQYTVFSQYMFNPYFVNPGAAGTETGIPIAFGYHQSWTGFHNAPSMQILSGHSAINESMGAGGKIFNYTTGPLSRLGFEGTYSYRLELGSDMHLSLGISALLYQLNLNRSALDMKNNDDVVLLRTTNDKMIVPDAAFGAYLYQDNFFVGLSATQLLGRKVDLMSDVLQVNQERHYYLTGGYNFEFSDNFSLEPSLLTRFVEAMMYQVDINVKAGIKKLAFVGVSYRSNLKDLSESSGDAVVGMIGLNMDNLMFGYSYDYTLSDIGNYSNGSHEIMLIIKLGNNSGTTKIH